MKRLTHKKKFFWHVIRNPEKPDKFKVVGSRFKSREISNFLCWNAAVYVAMEFNGTVTKGILNGCNYCKFNSWQQMPKFPAPQSHLTKADCSSSST